MIKLGFIGAQSRHAEYFGSLFNKQHLFEGVRVNAIWGGDAPDRVETISNELGINKIADTADELISEVDAVLVLLRNGNEHMEYAVDALKKGKPVFVDKPFAIKVEDAHIIADTAKRTGTPLFGGSTLRHLLAISDIKKRVEEDNISHVSIRYSADLSSPFGGYYFYGSHLAEICTALCGRDFGNIKVIKRENDVCTIIEYPHLIAMLHSSPYAKSLDISLFSSKVQHFSIDESSCYRSGMELFVRMVKTGVPPLDYEDLVRPVEMLDKIVHLL